jgi:acyl carrier protein
MLDTSTAVSGSKIAQVVNDIAMRNGVKRPIGQTEGLVDSGLNSIAMVDLMLAIEAAFDIAIPPPYLTPENFRSIASIEAVMSRLSVGSA